MDTKELRRLAQEATPGPWKMLPVGDGRQKFAVADSEFLSILTVTDEGDATFGTVYDDADARFISAANPAAINELLDRLEAAESDALEQARLNGMGASREAALMAKLDAAEKERDELRAELTGMKEKCGEYIERIAAERRNVVSQSGMTAKARKERDALRAKVEAMENQEPVAWARKLGLDVPSPGCVTDLKYRPSDIPESAYMPLYALPGAQPAPSHALDDNATIAGLESAVTHLSVLLDSFRALLVEVNDVCGRDGHGGQLEDGESEIIDKVRAAISMTEAPPCAKGEEK